MIAMKMFRNMRTRMCAVPLITASLLLIFFTWNKTGFDATPNEEVFSQKMFFENCVAGHEDALNIGNLLSFVNSWKSSVNQKCRSLLNVFTDIFRLHEDSGTIVVPPKFHDKLLNWMDGDSTLVGTMATQTVITIYNKVLNMGTTFNPLRAKRPKPQSTKLDNGENHFSNYSSSCDFCNYKSYTAEDVFGRLESHHAFTIANAFKLDAWNSLVVLRSHNPHSLSKEQLSDALQLASQWFSKVHSRSPEHRFPVLVWDLMPAAGASQVHPHLHVMISKQQYYGEAERWNQANQQYTSTHKASYFEDILRLSKALGLSVSHGGAHALTLLTPHLNNEVLLLAGSTDKDFQHLLYIVIQVYSRRLGIHSFSLCIVYPTLNDEKDSSGVFARIMPRTTNTRADISSLEIFASSSISEDPFTLAELIQQETESS